MKLRWLGHACFEITHKGYTVVIDPYNSKYTAGYPPLRVKADKLLISHEHYGHNYREGVILSGRPESDCPFEIAAMRVDHDSVGGIMRGTCLIHILEADGLKVAHMGDIGTRLNGGEVSRLFGADAIMVTAGSCTGLPSQEVWRMTDELFPKAIIPMHYRFGNYGPRRLEHIENLINYFESPEMIHYYDTDSIIIDENTEPQVAVLKYRG
ncbi:MAG: MBL fold metallo-hydrolase [Oscillospiraceae bacterium]|nr:MBL fold metallo-hydrolase [Oscillospiraceae bacterium]MBR0353646.1 MBL fold metallo-hydrolase [Oscillospiraceae bacterium]